MSPTSNKPSIVIVGTGFSGICMAIKLKQTGFRDFVILEKNEDLGGTWRDNHYPGCACDVPSHMYSFSFELNPDWSRMFAPQEEIWAYLRHCVDKYGVAAHIHYRSEVERMESDDAARRWHVTTTSGEVYTTHAIVSGVGGLHVPSIPEIRGPTGSPGPPFTRRSGTRHATFRASGSRSSGLARRRSSSSRRSPSRPGGCTCSSGRRRGFIPGRTSNSRPRSAPPSAPRRLCCARGATGSTGCSRAAGPDSRRTPS